MQALLLKAVATIVTMVATAVSAVYVSAHVKNPTAPLHPPVLNGSNSAGEKAGGKLAVAPSVRSTTVQAVTSTYPS
jgi:hypothetical protein